MRTLCRLQTCRKFISNPNMELQIHSVNIVSSQLVIILMLKLMMVGKKHCLKYQRHILIVNLLNNMVSEEATKMSKSKKSERNTEINLCEKPKELTNLNSIKDINITKEYKGIKLCGSILVTPVS